MNLLDYLTPPKKGFLQRLFFPTPPALEVHRWENYPSQALARPVTVEVILPPGYFRQNPKKYPLLLLNDGQDLPTLGTVAQLAKLYASKRIQNLLLVAVHAGDRMQEYGTAGQPDYQKRGSKAAAYTRFIIKELLPELEQRYRLLPGAEHRAIAGFSLGGLSAFDIAWKQPEYFSKVGVFSGSLWWRSKPFRPTNPDADRIPQVMVETGEKREGLSFWFQAGTKDETSDRNNNGIIDAIDDTLQLMDALEEKGYQRGRDIRYLEMEGGEHNPATWKRAMPDFLRWAFGVK